MTQPLKSPSVEALTQVKLDYLIGLIAAAFGAYERETERPRDIEGFADVVVELLLHYEAGIEAPSAQEIAAFFRGRMRAWEP